MTEPSRTRPADPPPRPSAATGTSRSGRHRRTAPALTVAALATAGLLGAAAPSSPAAAAAHTANDHARSTTSATAAPGSRTRQVTLITGDVAMVRPGGAVVTRRSGSPAGTEMLTMHSGDDTYVFPTTAVPYLHDHLDLALFDVTGPGAANRKVTLTYRPGHPHHAVPGLTATGGSSGSGTTVTATVTNPKAFGAALARQNTEDHQHAGHHAATGRAGLFADLTGIAPAGATTHRGVHTDYQMATLTLNTIKRDGDGDDLETGTFLFNLDDLRRYDDVVDADIGESKFSVPVGHYAALEYFRDDSGFHIVTAPNITVTAAGGRATLDARTATARLTATAPRPASLYEVSEQTAFTDGRGTKTSFTVTETGDVTVVVAPTTHAPAVGSLIHRALFNLRSTGAASPGYDYTLFYRDKKNTIAADQSHTPAAASLASVDATYSSDGGTHNGYDFFTGAYRGEVPLTSTSADLTTPTRRTNYYNTGQDLFFDREWIADTSTQSENGIGLGDDVQAPRSYQPGQHLRTTWAAQPRHPRLLEHGADIDYDYLPVVHPGGELLPGRTLCPACVDGTTVEPAVYPFGDNEPDHHFYPDDPTKGLTEKVSHTVTADGKTVTSGSGTLRAPATMPAGAKTYGFSLDTTRHFKGLYELSDVTHTTWTTPASASTVLPEGWACNDSAQTRNCHVLPLITNSYHLPVDLHGSLPAGATKASLDLGHLAGASSTFSTPVFEVSYDGGKSWKKTTVSGGTGGHYGLAFTVPAKASTDGYGAIRLTAKDATGSTLTQTVHRAFSVR